MFVDQVLFESLGLLLPLQLLEALLVLQELVQVARPLVLVGGLFGALFRGHHRCESAAFQFLGLFDLLHDLEFLALPLLGVLDAGLHLLDINFGCLRLVHVFLRNEHVGPRLIIEFLN